MDNGVRPPGFLDGGGEVGALMRGNDWSSSPLGAPETWRQSLRSVVEAWARQSGYHVEWTSRRDYRISDDIRAGTYTGTFQEALMRLANAFGQLETPLGMSFSSSAGGKALRVFDL